MIRLPILLAFLALTPVLSVGQSQTGSQTNPGTTVTPAASSTSTNPNRQQELYDQYHGIERKTRPEPATTTGGMSRSESGRANTPTGRPPRTRPDRPARSTASRERTAPASADVSTSGVRIGVRGGVTYPVFLETFTGVDPALGFTGGVVFQFGSGALSFQPEINYTRNATKSVFDDGFGNQTTFTGATDRIEIPLLLKIASGSVNSNRFFVNIGPYASYALNVSLNGKTQSLDGANGRLGFGAAAGIGTALKAGPGHLTIELRGLYSLGNVNDGFDTDSKTINAQATLGYMIPLGGR